MKVFLFATVIALAFVSAFAAPKSVPLGNGATILKGMCSYISKFLGQAESTRQSKVTEIANYEAEMKSLNEINKSKFKNNEKLLLSMRNRVLDSQSKMKGAEANVQGVEKDITNVNALIAQENSNYARLGQQIDSANKQAAKDIMALEMKVQRNEAALKKQMSADTIKKLEKDLAACNMKKEESAKMQKMFDAMSKKTTKVTTALATQLGEVKTMQKEVVTQGAKIRKKVDGKWVQEFEEKKTVETSVEGKLGMIVTNMEAEVSELALWLQQNEGAKIFTDDMMDMARKQHEEEVNTVQQFMDEDMKALQQKQARFRGGAKLLRHTEAVGALHKAMSKITAHVKKSASGMGKAHQSLHTSILCDTAEDCQVLNLKTAADFKKQIDQVAKTYTDFYGGLCALQKEFKDAKAKQAEITKKTWDDYYKQDAEHKSLQKTIDKFAKDLKTIDEEYKKATMRFKSLEATLLTKQKEVSDLKWTMDNDARKNDATLQSLVMRIQELVTTMNENTQQQQVLAASHQECLAKHKNIQADIEKMKAAALAGIQMKATTDAQMKAYKETVSAERDVLTEAADTLNKMRDDLMSAETKVNVATLTAANFSPEGSGRVDGQ